MNHYRPNAYLTDFSQLRTRRPTRVVPLYPKRTWFWWTWQIAKGLTLGLLGGATFLACLFLIYLLLAQVGR